MGEAAPGKKFSDISLGSRSVAVFRPTSMQRNFSFPHGGISFGLARPMKKKGTLDGRPGWKACGDERTLLADRAGYSLLWGSQKPNSAPHRVVKPLSGKSLQRKVCGIRWPGLAPRARKRKGAPRRA